MSRFPQRRLELLLPRALNDHPAWESLISHGVLDSTEIVPDDRVLLMKAFRFTPVRAKIENRITPP